MASKISKKAKPRSNSPAGEFTTGEVEYIAKLARLEISEKEKIINEKGFLKMLI